VDIRKNPRNLALIFDTAIAMASYYYPLIGGSMLASSIYHLYYYNGNILGISGIYESFLQRTFASVQSACTHEPSPKVPPEPLPPPTTYGTATPAREEAAEESMPASDTNWKPAFLAGLLLGGVFLRSFRPMLESRLGVPIFEDGALKEMSNHPLVTLFLAGLIGAGTRVDFRIFNTLIHRRQRDAPQDT
jgi:hypothetical protein